MIRDVHPGSRLFTFSRSRGQKGTGSATPEELKYCHFFFVAVATVGFEVIVVPSKQRFSNTKFLFHRRTLYPESREVLDLDPPPVPWNP